MDIYILRSMSSELSRTREAYQRTTNPEAITCLSSRMQEIRQQISALKPDDFLIIDRPDATAIIQSAQRY